MVRIIKILGLHYISTGPYPVCRVTEAAFVEEIHAYTVITCASYLL